MKTMFTLIALVGVLGARVTGPVVAGLKADKSREALAHSLLPVPLVLTDVPLTKALGELGGRVSDGYVLFGVEVFLEKGEEPAVRLDLPAGKTVGDALNQIFIQLPGYTFEVFSPHMIMIYPRGADRDPSDLLNTRIAYFHAVDIHPSDILSRPQEFVPELKARLTPQGKSRPSGHIGGIHGSGATISVRVKDVTLRQLLNVVSEATEQFPPSDAPMGWVYFFEANPQSAEGATHSWMFLWSAPSTWKKQKE